MNTIAAFGIEFVVTVLTGFLLMQYLRPSLSRILIDLCGGEDRARFWTAFATVLLIGVPAATALGYRPLAGSFADAFFSIARQLGQNVMGFLGALVALGIVVAFFALVAPRTTKVQQP